MANVARAAKRKNWVTSGSAAGAAHHGLFLVLAEVVPDPGAQDRADPALRHPAGPIAIFLSRDFEQVALIVE
jgi:hypothetical protein